MKYATDLLLAENYITRLVLDFSDTCFMDSSGIGILLNRYKQSRAGGGEACFYGAGQQVLRVLKVAGILGLMKRYETREEALCG